MEDVFVRLVTLPWNTPALTVVNDDDTFDVYINVRLPEELRTEAFRHEMEHIRKNHFYNDDPVGLNEQEAGDQV